MRWLQAVLGEVFGLFVDDGSFALAIVVWVGIVWLVRPWLPISPAWSGIILFAGLALILAESALRRARR
jgi:hypothetical protein